MQYKENMMNKISSSLNLGFKKLKVNEWKVKTATEEFILFLIWIKDFLLWVKTRILFGFISFLIFTIIFGLFVK